MHFKRFLAILLSALMLLSAGLLCLPETASADEEDLWVLIERYEDEAYTHWYYLCAFDAEANILSSSMGVKEHSEREGEPLTVVYEDGQAEFILDGDGNLIWKDATEDAGEGLVFARSNG